MQHEIKIAKSLAVAYTTIDVAANVTESGIAGSSGDIDRLDQALIRTMESDR
jgi:hypothetical protein